MEQDLQQLIKQSKGHFNVMENLAEQQHFNNTYNQYDFFESLLSLSYSFQRPLSDQNFSTLKTAPKDNSIAKIGPNPAECCLTNKNHETEPPLSPKPLTELLKKHLPQLSNLMLEDLDQDPKTRIKDQIKTFPNYIFRTFVKHLPSYEHLYAQKDGLEALKNYLENHLGAKYYTLQQLQVLFKGSSAWNTKLNRAILVRILALHSYHEIFSNTQRKKKKTYLIMSKVYKLRSRSSLLCSRVQCQ